MSVLARVIAEERGCLLLAIVELVDLGPLRPGIVGGALDGGFGTISNCNRLLQPCRIEVPTQSVPVSPPPMTITSLSLAEMIVAVLVMAVEQALRVGVQELHREVDALELPALGLAEEVVRLGGAAAQDDGVEVRSAASGAG